MVNFKSRQRSRSHPGNTSGADAFKKRSNMVTDKTDRRTKEIIVKFGEGDWIIEKKTGSVQQVLRVSKDSKEYAFENCLGRTVWFEAKDIDKSYEATTPRYPISAFDF